MMDLILELKYKDNIIQLKHLSRDELFDRNQKNYKQKKTCREKSEHVF